MKSAITTPARPALAVETPAGPLRARLTADLAPTDLLKGASALARLLSSVEPWTRGEASPRIQLSGLYLCMPLRRAITDLRYYLRQPCTAENREYAAAACQQAAYRLIRHGATWTAGAFAEAGGVLEPSSPWHPLVVARLVREHGRSVDAWAWYRWAAQVARDGRDGVALSAVLTEMGSMATDEDRHALAGKLFVLAGRVARRCGCPAYEGESLLRHGLMRHGLGYREEANDKFLAALRAYGPGHPDLPAMGLQVASCWLAEGHHRDAAEVYGSLASYTTGSERLEAAAGAARTASALRWQWHYEAAWNSTWELMSRGCEQAQVEAALQLARAAATMKDTLRARQASLCALHMANHRGDTAGAERAREMFAVLGMPGQTGTEAREDVFPDLRTVRLGLMHDWDSADPAEPWAPGASVRSLALAFSAAVKFCEEVRSFRTVARS